MTVPTEPALMEPVAVPTPRWRRPVLVLLWVAFALWVAGLSAMYAFEVYPDRHPAKQPAPPAQVAP